MQWDSCPIAGTAVPYKSSCTCFLPACQSPSCRPALREPLVPSLLRIRFRGNGHIPSPYESALVSSLLGRARTTSLLALRSRSNRACRQPSLLRQRLCITLLHSLPPSPIPPMHLPPPSSLCTRGPRRGVDIPSQLRRLCLHRIHGSLHRRCNAPVLTRQGLGFRV
jgi:hypothetical protein